MTIHAETCWLDGTAVISFRVNMTDRGIWLQIPRSVAKGAWRSAVPDRRGQVQVGRGADALFEREAFAV